MDKRIRLFLNLSSYLLPYWRILLSVMLATLLSVALGLINPYITKLIIDKAYILRDLRLFLTLAMIGGAVFVFNISTTSLTNFLMQSLHIWLHRDITQRVFAKIQAMDIRFFQDRNTGEHLFKIDYDIRQVAQFLINSIPQLLFLTPRFVCVLVIVFLLDHKMALFTLMCAPLTLIGPYLIAPRMRRKIEEYIKAYQSVFMHLKEVFSHIYLVKVFSKEQKEVQGVKLRLEEIASTRRQNAGLEAMGNLITGLSQKIILGLVAFYGGWRVMNHSLSLGSLAAVTLYLSQIVNFHIQIGNLLQSIMLGLVSCERLGNILETNQAENELPTSCPVSFPKGEIEFSKVSFSYPSDKDILRQISFKIRAGSRVALIGPSGTGKTTILHLLLRLYDIKDGVILIDGYDIRNVRIESLRRQIGVAPQEPFLWDDTVMNNIRYGREEATDDEVIHAAQHAHAHGFIVELTQGYLTIVGESGCKISEGQKQRLAIARALLKRPKILILDEAMASIEPELEDAILTDIEQHYHGITLVMITHRLSSLKRMDGIYYFDCPDTMRLISYERLIEEKELCNKIVPAAMR